MKYMRQFGIIMLITCIGEMLKFVLPLSVPAGNLWSVSDVVSFDDRCGKTGACERCGVVFDRNYAADVYTCGGRAPGILGAAERSVAECTGHYGGSDVCGNDRFRQGDGRIFKEEVT